MIVRRRLLWIDCTAAAVAGVIVLLIHGWLSGWYGLPQELLIFIGAANVIYASYSGSLAVRARRPKHLILILVAANLLWSMVFVMIALTYKDTATLLGLAHLLGEALFVGGLAVLEWRWRELLLAA